jgi:carboxylate-amine ligase
MIKDPSKIWWDLRPSANHPTLEMRICDVCTRIEDSMAMVALYQSLIAYLIDLRGRNERRREYRPTLLRENRWRAQRYGIEAEMGDFGKRTLVSFVDLTDEIVALVQPYADDLGCAAELAHIRTIARDGTSADHQLRVFNDALSQGASEREAQIAVVDWLTDISVKGCGTRPDAG